MTAVAAAAAALAASVALLPFAQTSSPIRNAYDLHAPSIASVRVVERNETVFGTSFDTEKNVLGVFLAEPAPDGAAYAIVPGRVVTESLKRVRVASMTVRLHDGSEAPAAFVAKDRAANVALLRVDLSGLPRPSGVDFAAAPGGPEVGDDVLLHARQAKSLFYASCVHRGLANGRIESGGNALVTVDGLEPTLLGALATDLDGTVLGLVVEPVFSSQARTAAPLAGADSGRRFGAPVVLAARRVASAVARLRAAALPGETALLREDGWFGARVQALPGAARAAFGVASGSGALLVSRVFPGGPAETAGLAAGDVVVAIDGASVPLAGLSGVDVAPAIAAGRSPGTRLCLAVRRGGAAETTTIGIVLAGAPDGIDDVPVERFPAAGLTARELTIAERADRELPPDHGVLVIVAETAGPCGLAGLRPDDVLAEIDGVPLRTLAELGAALATGAKRRGGMLLGVIRDRERIVLGVPER